ncbi:Acetylornithine deacetylase [Halomonadaceae bacterium LMG 33818]|uniref:acetylornithine deacetylase n=1 Tax=Cernens ardua TaxID=3402176 RepID=UPI003EDC983E
MSFSEQEYATSTRTWLSQLISFDTVSRNSNLSLIEYIESQLALLSDTEGQPVRAERIENAAGDKSNLLIRIGPAVEGGVALSGHTDVVPVDGQPWHSDPFTLEEREGKLYGRGSCDMKGFIAAALSHIPEWRTLDLKRPLYVALSYDEEVGCVGAPHLIEHMNASAIHPELVIIGEPTMMKPITQQKGISDLYTTVRGVEAHSSQIPDGVSAIHVAARLVNHIENIMLEMKQQADCCNAAYNVPYSTLHVGTIQGGTAVNIMAGECTFHWEIRDLPEIGFHAIYEKYERYAKALEQEIKQTSPMASITTHLAVDSVPGLNATEDDPAVRFLKPLLEDQHSGAVAFATEAGQFQQGGYAAVICGPGDIAQAHKADEFVSIEQLNKVDVLMSKIGEQLTRPESV